MKIAACASALAMIGLAVFAAAPGCGAPCSSSERTFTEGAVEYSTGLAWYESSPPSGPFLPFDGYTLLHVQHGLGVTPAYVQVYLSFSERPEEVGGGGSSLAAGNQALLLKTDATEIAVKNDSCAAYWVRVVAIAPHADDDAGVSTEAGSD